MRSSEEELKRRRGVEGGKKGSDGRKGVLPKRLSFLSLQVCFLRGRMASVSFVRNRCLGMVREKLKATDQWKEKEP